MAQQTIVTYPAVAKDSKLGTPIADAFKMVNDNFDEVYGKPDLSLAANILTLTKPDGTTDTVDLSPYLDEDARAIASGTIDGAGIVTFTRDDASTFTLDLSSLLDDTVANDATITLTAGSGLTGGGDFTTNQSSAETITLDVNVDDVTIEVATDTVQVKDDGISYAKMGAEFTTSAVISASDVDFSSAQVFTKTLTGTTALTYSSASIGMVKDLVINADGNSFTLPAGTKIIAGTATTGINFIQVVVTASGEYWTSISQQQ